MKTELNPRWAVIAFLMVASSIILSGCAQYTAINQPKPFKPTAAVVGAKRVSVAGELGSPVSTEEQNGRLQDTYKYVDGGSKNNGTSKTCRVVLYSAGDLFTIFLDQLLTWPAETYGFAGTSHLVTVKYVKGSDGFWQAKEVDDQVLGADQKNKVAPAQPEFASPRSKSASAGPQPAPAVTEPAPAKTEPAPAVTEPVSTDTNSAPAQL